MKENAACVFQPSRCHVELVILLFLSLQKMICVSNWTFWSVRRECYTIGKSGLKHQERQNSQSWAHKLHWCGIISSFACGASLSSPCAVLILSCHLSYPELASNHIYSIICWIVLLLLYFFQSTFSYNVNVFHFTRSAVWFVFSCVPWTYLVFLVLHCVFFSLCSLAVFWIPKCSACSLEGE